MLNDLFHFSFKSQITCTQELRKDSEFIQSSTGT